MLGFSGAHVSVIYTQLPTADLVVFYTLLQTCVVLP